MKNEIKVDKFSFLGIKKKQLTDIFISEVRKDLTIYTEEYMTEEITENKFFYEDNDNLLIPRNYPLEKKFKKYKFNIVDNTTEGESINIIFTRSLRDEIQEQSASFLIKHRYGVLQLPPGTGKTVISIYAMCKLKKKTLIVVDQEKLLTQWKSRLLEFTNIKEEDIGIYQGDIKQLDKPVVIAMCQSMLSNLKRSGVEASKMFYNANFGLSIIDEAHTIVGSPKTTNIVGLICSYRLIGLSATPSRGDESTKIIYYWLSDNLLTSKTYNLKPHVKIIFFDSKMKQSKTNSYVNYGGKFNLVRYNNQLIKREFITNAIIKNVVAAYNKDRFPLVLGQLRKQLENYQDKLLVDHKIDKEKIGLFIGGSKEEEKDKKIVLSTFKMTSKGIDNKHWDSLFLTSSFSKHELLEQAIGRILRAKDNKQQPIVLDYVDISYQMLIYMYFTRMKLYNKLDFKVTFHVNKETIPDSNRIKNLIK